jgi:hypothetical protein
VQLRDSTRPRCVPASSLAAVPTRTPADTCCINPRSRIHPLTPPRHAASRQIEAYLSGVPAASMLILDLFTDSVPVWNRPGVNSYFQRPWVWNMLQVFGGRRGIYGNLPLLATSIVQSRLAANSTMVGIGATPEAIDMTPVTFDLLFDMGWRAVSPNVTAWLTQYGQRRYGASSPSITAALQILLNATWTLPYGYGTTDAFCWLQQEPAIVRSDYDGTDADGLLQALRLYVAAGVNGEVDATLGPYRYDLVDVARQFMCNAFADVFNLMGWEFRLFQLDGRNTSASVLPTYAAMLQMIGQLDTLLATDTNFLLGNWLADAAQWAQTPVDGPLLQLNARNQITLWGPNGGCAWGLLTRARVASADTSPAPRGEPHTACHVRRASCLDVQRGAALPASTLAPASVASGPLQCVLIVVCPLASGRRVPHAAPPPCATGCTRHNPPPPPPIAGVRRGDHGLRGEERLGWWVRTRRGMAWPHISSAARQHLRLDCHGRTPTCHAHIPPDVRRLPLHCRFPCRRLWRCHHAPHPHTPRRRAGG